MAIDRVSAGGDERRELKVTKVIGIERENSGFGSRRTSDWPPDSPMEVNKKIHENAEKEEEDGLGIFPPLITTLNENGRPRFKFERVKDKDGRLTMCLVPSECRSVFRCVRSGGRLIMHLIDDADYSLDDADYDIDDDDDHKIYESDHSRSVYVVDGDRYRCPPYHGGQ